jgi:C4-dicarboxylate-specific signal transduction histidine kinase
MRRSKKSLLVSIITLVVLTALTTLLIGYWISLANLRRSLEAREEDKVSAIHSIVKAIVGVEIDKLKAVSSLIRNDAVLALALAAYGQTKRITPLRSLLDRLYEGLDVDLLTVTDARGINLYSAKTGRRDGTSADLGNGWPSMGPR